MAEHDLIAGTGNRVLKLRLRRKKARDHLGPIWKELPLAFSERFRAYYVCNQRDDNARLNRQACGSIKSFTASDEAATALRLNLMVCHGVVCQRHRQCGPRRRRE